MQSKLCILTVASGDSYSFFIPLFIYTAKRAYPEYDVKVYVRGKLLEPLRNTLKMIRDKKMCDDNWTVTEKAFGEYPKAAVSSLRVLLPYDELKEYDYVYFTDIDFLIFRHKKTLFYYYRKMMEKAYQEYAAPRGAQRMPRSPKITPLGWNGAFTRIAIANCMASRQWLLQTDKIRRQYRHLIKKGWHDKYDKHKPCSYREYDEVMMYRILRLAKMKRPDWPGYFTCGKKFDTLYRDIHLGDFKFQKRWRKMGKMLDLIDDKNIREYKILRKEENWRTLANACSHGTVSKMLKNLDIHVKARDNR